MPEKEQIVGGHYKILGKLGSGGMGTVFHALDTHLNREVALKFAHKDLLELEEYRQRFWIEGRILASLRHPNIVGVHTLEIEENSKAPFLVMEYIAGKPISALIREKEKKSKLLPYFLQAVHGIEACHKKGIIHRDIKPDNFLIEGEVLKIVDFGLAKTDIKLTKTGATIGTATYMSPEQCMGTSELTPKSDVYALGIIFWELLTGEPPFEADGNSENPFMSLSLMHLNSPPPFDRLRRDIFTNKFVGLIEKMLSKKPEERPELGEIASFLDQAIKDYREPDDAPGGSPPNLDLRITLGSLRKGRF